MALGDPIPAILEWIRTDPALTAVCPAANMGRRLPEAGQALPPLPFVRVLRIGGTPTRSPWAKLSAGRDEALVDVAVFAEWQADDVAQRVAALVRARLAQCVEFARVDRWGQTVTVGCREESSGPVDGWDDTRTPPLTHLAMTWRVTTTTT